MAGEVQRPGEGMNREEMRNLRRFLDAGVPAPKSKITIDPARRRYIAFRGTEADRQRHLSQLESNAMFLKGRREHVLSARTRTTLAADVIHDTSVIDHKLADSLQREMLKFQFIKMIMSAPSSKGKVTSEMRIQHEELLQNWYDTVFSVGLGISSAEQIHDAALQALGDLQSYYMQDWDPAWNPIQGRESSVQSLRSRISALKTRWRTAVTATEGDGGSINTGTSEKDSRDFRPNAHEDVDERGSVLTSRSPARSPFSALSTSGATGTDTEDSRTGF